MFTSERAGSADLYRIHPDGTGLERLTDDPAYDDQGAPSPDGKQIVFVARVPGGRANLWMLEVATHKARPLTSGDGGDFRPAYVELTCGVSATETRLPLCNLGWGSSHIRAAVLTKSSPRATLRIASVIAGYIHGTVEDSLCLQPTQMGDPVTVFCEHQWSRLSRLQH